MAIQLNITYQSTQKVRRLSLVRVIWGSNPEMIKSPTRWQRLATVAILICGPWRKAAELDAAYSWHPRLSDFFFISQLSTVDTCLLVHIFLLSVLTTTTRNCLNNLRNEQEIFFHGSYNTFPKSGNKLRASNSLTTPRSAISLATDDL